MTKPKEVKTSYIDIRVDQTKKTEIINMAKQTHHSTGQFLVYCYEKYKEINNINL